MGECLQKIKLFCLPYAGGSAISYVRLKKYLKSNIELYPIELSGRGRRFNESFYQNFDEAVNDASNIIIENLDGTPYAILGHSMGCWLGLELAYKLKEMGLYSPVHMFLSGRYPPTIKKNEILLHTLPMEEFMSSIFELGGTPKELLEHKELYNIYSKILYTDIKMLETFIPSQHNDKLDCNFTIFYGKNDNKMSLSDANEWGFYTKRNSKVYGFEGGHFFIHENEQDIAEVICERLTDESIKYAF